MSYARRKAQKQEAGGSLPAVSYQVLEHRRGKLVPSTKARRHTGPRKGARKVDIPAQPARYEPGFEDRDLGNPFDYHEPYEEEALYSDEEGWIFEPAAPPEPRDSNSTASYLPPYIHIHGALIQLFKQDSAPSSPTCGRCKRHGISTLYRCLTCLGDSPICAECICLVHTHCPTHRIRAWNGRFWEDHTLADLGLIRHLGHQSERCPNNDPDFDNKIWVGDLNGFSTVRVTFCECKAVKKLPRGLQLIDLGIFPCSDDQPRSGFTISLLRYFSIFSTLSKGSGHKFYSLLERSTCPGFPSKLPNRSRELLATHRRFTYMLLRRRSGQAYPATTPLSGDDDFAIQCPACPNPGVNFVQDEVKPEELPFMRFWLSYDGNFRNPRKAKKVDKDDFSYTEGNMFYVDQQKYKDWLRDAGKQHGKRQSESRPECDNHKAAQGKYVKWGGLDVTGLGAFTCARHSMFLPRGLVDFYQGELFAYADYAFASVVLWLLRNGPLEFGVTYDIWCHWITKLAERLDNLPDELALPPGVRAGLVGGIPKFHLQGHAKELPQVSGVSKDLRRALWRSPVDFPRFLMRIEGEGAERAWAYLNETSGSTSEKSPGARWDSINLIILDWNFEKEVRMGLFLVSKFLEAKKMFTEQLGVFNELHRFLPAPLTTEWETISTEPTEYKRGKWTSPFEETERPAPGVQETIAVERAKEGATADKKAKVSGTTKWISSAIELEYSMELLRREEAKLGKNSTPRQHNQINDKRSSLNNRVQSNRTKQASYMGDIPSPDHPKRRIVSSRHPEYSELGLPSSYLSSTLKEHSRVELLELELQLRRAACNDALRSVRHLLGAKALLLRYKRKHTSGERATTRSEGIIKEQQEKVSRAQWRYNNSREALLRHSEEESDSETYKEIKNGDLRRLDDYLDDSKRVGQGYEAIAWIWRPINTPQDEAWQAEALRTEWFRARQRYRQWEEELKIVKREMVMTIRTYEYRASVWGVRSRATGLGDGLAEYAARKSQFYSKLAADSAVACMEHIKDPIVTMEWASEWVTARVSKE